MDTLTYKEYIQQQIVEYTEKLSQLTRLLSLLESDNKVTGQTWTVNLVATFQDK